MNEADIPIDIHTGKLQDWLISRRIVPKNIQIKDIRNKISNALKDMPAHDDLIKLLAGAHINYFHCLKIIEILKQTEKDSKSVFGTYGSQRMKDWQEIMKLYEKENVYLAEAAQILIRNITYEIPGIKKQMAKLEQQSEEASKKIIDLDKTEIILKHEQVALCQQLGIQGENLEEEFLAKLKELPTIYSKSIENIGLLEEPIQYYAEFTGNNTYLPILRHVLKFGNTTVYQYVHKEAPVHQEERPIKLNISEEYKIKKVKDDNEIDFGDGEIDMNIPETIDFGDIQLVEEGDIDWGITTENVTDEDNNSSDVPLEEYGIVVEGVGMDGGIAKGEQAYTILDSPNYRDKFIDELYELESFLKLRVYELGITENSSNIMFSLMDALSTHDSISVKKMLKNVDDLIHNIMLESTQHLFQLKHSPKYANILASKLTQKIKAIDKIIITKKVLKLKSIECNQEKINLNPVLSKLIEQTKELQNQIEKDISKRYKNRIVNLIGGVHTI